MRYVLSVLGLMVGLLSVPILAQTEVDQLLNDGIEAQTHGDYDRAIRDYRKLLELQPSFTEAKVNLAAALVNVGQFDEAISLYTSVLPTIPEKGTVQFNLALAYFKKGDFEIARQHLEALHKAQPRRLQVAILLAAAQVESNQPEAAVAVLQPLESANSQNADLKYALGAALIKSGKLREGVSRVQQVADTKKSADAYLLAGRTLLDLNENEQARQDLDTALSLDPTLPGVQTLAGKARDKTGDKPSAEAAFRDGLRINPDDFEANLYLGAILEERRVLDESKTYLDRALKLKPTDSMARYESAMLESMMGHLEIAADKLETLTVDDPKWMEPHVQLAALYYKLHRNEDGARERSIVDRMTAEQQQKGPEPQ